MMLSEPVRSFLGLLAARRRLGRPEVLLAVLRKERDRRQGRATGLVESAGPLSVIQVARIRESLGKALGTQLTLTHQRNPDLLDGVRVMVGDRVFDLTARTWLKSLRERLATVR
jgi:F0F1-type ATP synthase delta subunit